jgi:hypothetical protein
MPNSVNGRKNTVSGKSYRCSLHLECGDADNPSTGDIVSVEMPGVRVIIINSYETVQDILAKRPGTTGGRKIGYMTREV